MAVLAASVFVAILVSKYEVRIPKTNFIFSANAIFVFFGIVSLGTAGGVLLAACAAAAAFNNYHGNRWKLVIDIARDMICAFAAGTAFQAAFLYLKDANLFTSDAGLLIPNEAILAGSLMAFVHFGFEALLSLALGKLAADAPHDTRLRELFVAPAVVKAIAFVATVLLVIAFDYFGTAFGLVIIPIAIVGNLAYEIHTRRLENQTKQIYEASRMHLATVEALATAIDARDQVGVGHVRRTQIYAVGLGNLLRLGDDEINALRTGALLHDIGKLAVPDHILNKPGRLTSAEMEKTKIHSSVGASILEKIGFTYPVVPTVRHHHEFWDGGGYPDGLRGSSIPLTARILSVADAYDTLRGARPYRPAVSREDACNFLRARVGTQFDPNIVNLFLRNLRNLEAEVESQGLEYRIDVESEVKPRMVGQKAPAPNFVEQIKRANREVFTLYEMARDFGSSLNLEGTLSLFTAKVAEFVPFDTCLVYLLDESEDFATAVYVSGKNEKALKGKRVTVGEGATGYVLKKCKPVENVDPSLDFLASQSEISQDYLAMACLPLLADEKVIGAISLYSGELAVYEEEHLRLLETISRIAADAIGKSVRHAETESHALTDPMTGLPNARSLKLQFEKEMARAKRSGHNLQLLMLDLDGFKAVNDTFGHKVGDTMLEQIGGVIKNELRDYDFLARYGGDEFVALVPETDSADVIELCRRIETVVSEFTLPVSDVSNARVGVSVGSSSFPKHGETFDQLIVSADKAMYRTKAFHKQRNFRLEEQLYAKSVSGSYELPAEFLQEDASEEAGGRAYEYDNELVVELDESHIVSFSSVN
ncbi:MAG: diguanylate cyclase [Pyrinomonadaceae bacterium]